MSAVNSTYTCPVGTRLRPMEYDRLKAVASERGVTVSALLSRYARELIRQAA
ncbi:MAG TPA: hypothetical protein VN848_07310 [Gemmatimonadales bacterium]|nr:hypothetical protein [Gemmatimonadales bacterium]